MVAARFAQLWSALEPIGRASSGGYRRFAWTREDAELREWFAGETAARGLDLVLDRAGNQWAWWGDPDADRAGRRDRLAPRLGARRRRVRRAARRGVGAARRSTRCASAGIGRRVRSAVVNFGDEEGARFGVACAGSRVITGALARRSRAGAARRRRHVAGRRADRAGPSARCRIATTKRCAGSACSSSCTSSKAAALADLGRPVAVGGSIWPHGRWRFDFARRGQPRGHDQAGRSARSDARAGAS